MHLGRRPSIRTASLGVRNLRSSFSLGVKQSHNPHMDVDNLVRQHTPNGIINNHSNSISSQREPIIGINLPQTKVNHARNYLEKAHKIIPEKKRNLFA